MPPDDQVVDHPREAAEATGGGRHRTGRDAISDRRLGMRSAREISNSYLGRSARLLPVVGVASVLTALAQAVVLVVLAATAVALVRDGNEVTFSAGPVHKTVPIWVATTGSAAASVLIIGLQIWSGRITARLAKIAEGECRRHIVAAYLGAPWELVAQRERGEFQQLLTNNVSRVSRAVVYRALWIFGVANLVILLAVGLVVSPFVAGLMIFVGVVLSLPLRPIKKRTERAAGEHNQAERSYATFIAAMVEQARETRVFNVGSMLGKRSLELSDEASERQRRMQFLMWTTPAIYFGAALLALTLGVALIASVGSSHLADIGTIIVLFMRSLVYGQTAVASTQYIVEATPYLVELNENLDVYNASHRPDGSREARPIEQLDLRDVQYTYPGAASPALRGISITIRRGEAIGVVGATGGGKSTFAEVLLRLRETTGGTYTVNDIPATDLSRESWGRQVAYVPQQSLIFDGTIRENIRYFRPWLTDADVENAARDAQIDTEIRGMENGYDTVVAGLSVGLSGGQRQRICIARALAGHPELLVMDEPTSGLDVHSERLFIETIERLKGNTTLVVIAHRLDTIAMCDRIVNVKAGRIIATGSPRKMLGTDGSYSSSPSPSPSPGRGQSPAPSPRPRPGRGARADLAEV